MPSVETLDDADSLAESGDSDYELCRFWSNEVIFRSKYTDCDCELILSGLS